MNIKNYFWVFPFLSFLIGYFVMEHVSRIAELEAPSIVGQHLQEAIEKLSNKDLNIRFIAQKEEPDLPQGTILSQTPLPGQKIKPHQALYVVVSKKPPAIAAPSLLNKSKDLLDKELNAMGIRKKAYYLPSNLPINSCIAQLPMPGNPIDDEKITIYLSSENKKPVLLPDFRKKTIHEVREFLQQYNIEINLVHTTKKDKKLNEKNPQNIISDQRPLPGSIVNLDDKKTLIIQLQVS